MIISFGFLYLLLYLFFLCSVIFFLLRGNKNFKKVNLTCTNQIIYGQNELNSFIKNCTSTNCFVCGNPVSSSNQTYEYICDPLDNLDCYQLEQSFYIIYIYIFNQ